MDKKKINISLIENFFNELLDGVVSDNVFFTSLPSSIQQTWNDLVVVKCSNAIRDMNAYGYGTVLVWLYAKPLSSGKKNLAVMLKMENALDEAIKNSNNATYQVKRRSEYADYDDKVKMHCNIVEIVTLIV